MQDSTQNNWRESLENADRFPSETMPNKNEAWEKLYARLHNTREQKMARWYWVAAAFLLAMIITAVVMIKEKQQPVSMKAAPPPVKISVPTFNQNQRLAKENNNRQVSISNHNKTLGSSPRLKNNTVEKIKTFISDEPLDTVNNALSTKKISFDSGIVTTVTPTPPKKKLRVVHLNEIGQPAEEPMVNKSIERHGFEFRIINNEIYHPSDAPATNGVILFKSRNTSN